MLLASAAAVGLCVLALVWFAFARRRAAIALIECGSVSTSWLAQHRANSTDGIR